MSDFTLRFPGAPVQVVLPGNPGLVQKFANQAVAALADVEAAAAGIIADAAEQADRAELASLTAQRSSLASSDHPFAIPGLEVYLDPFDASTCYSDTGGTVLAAIGDRVAFWRDKSGNGHHAVMATAANRPYLRADASGATWLEFSADGDGNKWMNTSGGGQSAQFSVFAVTRQDVDVTSTTRAIVSGRSSTNQGWSLIGNSGGGRIIIYNGTTGINATVTFPSEGREPYEVMLVGGIYDGTNAYGVNEDFIGAPAAVAMSANATPGVRVGMPKYTTAATSFLGRIGPVMIWNRALTVAERAKLWRWSQSLPVTQGDAVNALSHLRSVIEQEAVDPSILVDSDSTGDAQDEQIYRITAWLAEKYPRLGVSYRRFDYDTNAWGSTVIIQPSLNGRTLTVHNTAKSLSMPRKMMADRYANAVAGVPAPHLVIWNHGHNISDVNAAPTILGEYLAAMEQVRGTFPNARHVAIMQNPVLRNTSQDSKYTALRQIENVWRELQLIDTRAVFAADGFVSAYFEDAATNGIHPGPAGARVQAAKFAAYYKLASVTGGGAGTPFLASTATNRIGNGDFSAFSGAVPDGWTVGGGATITKDTVIKDGAAAYSVRIEGAGGYIDRAADAGSLTALKAAGTCTLFVRHRSTEGESRSAQAEVRVTTPAGTTAYGTVGGNNQGGAFQHGMVVGVPVPSDATAVTVRLYSSPDAVAGAVAHFGAATLVDGSVPKSAA